MVIDYDDLSEYAGVSIGTVSACEGLICLTNEIRFDAFGNPSDSNNASYTSAPTIALTNGTTTRTVQVTPETSFTEIV